VTKTGEVISCYECGESIALVRTFDRCTTYRCAVCVEQVRQGAKPKLVIYLYDVVLHGCCTIPKTDTSMQLSCIVHVILLDSSDCDT